MKTFWIALLAVVAVRAAAEDYEDFRKRVEAEAEPEGLGSNAKMRILCGKS